MGNWRDLPRFGAIRGQRARAMARWLLLVSLSVGVLGIASGVSDVALAAQPAGVAWPGLESLRRLDLLPFLAAGVQTFQPSSVDPTDHNDDGYDGAYSCLHRVRQGCLMAAHNGPGELESVWTAGNETGDVADGGRLMIELDGRLVVNATWPVLSSGALGSAFVFPFVLGSSQQLGAVSENLPMPFRHSMRVISQFNPHYFHVIYRTFASARGIASGVAPRSDIAAAASELTHAGTRDPKPPNSDTSQFARNLRVPARRHVVLAILHGSGVITQLRLRLTRYGSANAEAAARVVLTSARLQMTFDGRQTVDAPLGEFFGSGLGPARVRSLMFAMDPQPSTWMTAWWPMPFASSVRIVLDDASAIPIRGGEIQLRFARSARWRHALSTAGDAGYFHAEGHRGRTRRGVYWRLINVKGTGSFVGVTLTMMGGNRPYYLEGNERAYVDGARVPQIQGTGTEDFFGSGWYFGLDHLFTLPLAGYTARDTQEAGCPRPTCKTAYRIMVTDAVPFRHSLLYEIQHGPHNVIDAFYSSTACWYQRRDTRPPPRASR